MYLQKVEGRTEYPQGRWFGDTEFLHQCGGVCAKEHLGWGCFQVIYGDHEVTFTRFDDYLKTEDFEGATGRMYVVGGTDEAIEAIIAAVEAHLGAAK